jgi:hypothetical protein
LTISDLQQFMFYGGPIIVFVVLFLGIPVLRFISHPLEARDTRSKKERLRDIHID